MKREDIFILCVRAAGDQPLQPIHMKHSIYLIGQSGIPEVPPDYWTFEPGAHGPQNLEIERDVQHLVDQGLLWHFPSPRGAWKQYAITPSGAARARDLARQSNPASARHIQDLVAWVQANTVASLLANMRRNHPEQAVKSIFQPTGPPTA